MGDCSAGSAAPATELRGSDLLLALEQVLSMRAEVLPDDSVSKRQIEFAS